MPRLNSEFPQTTPSEYDDDFAELTIPEISEPVESGESQNVPRTVYYDRGHKANDAAAIENERLKNRERFIELQKRQQEIADQLKSLGITITEDPKFTAMAEKYLASFNAEPKTPEPESAPAEEPVEESVEEPTEAPAEPESIEPAPVTPAEVAGSAIKHKGFGAFVTNFVRKHARGIIAGLAITIGSTAIGGSLISSKYANAATGGGFLTEESATPSGGGTLEQSIEDALANPGSTPTIIVNTPDKPMPAPVVATETEAEAIESTDVSGETINGVKYDYSEYNDRENKTSRNAYGYDYSDQFDNRDKATEGILHMASTEPEALASYAYELLTASEKKELGIDGLSMVEIDNKFDKAGGGDLQSKLLDKLSQILNDQANTEFKFYHENGTENTHYIYFTDDNGDGQLTPDELHIGYDTKKRNNAPQVDIYRTIENENGTTSSQKMIDLNMYCGYQPNYVKAPAGVKHVPTSETITNVTPAPVITGGGTTTVTPPTITPPSVTPPTITPPNPTPIPTPPGPEPTPTPPPPGPPEPTPTPPGPTPTPAPKDAENLIRIDEEIKQQIEDNINTGELVITPTEDVTQVEEQTEKPTGDDYQGTEATTTESEASQAAETPTNISPENDASENRGGANEDNREPNPVQENEAEQQRADENETSQSEAPQSSEEVRSALEDLGIS